MIYTYVCKDCGETFDIEKSIKEPHPIECKECGGRLRKVYKPTNVVYKGSGFYTTDKALYEPGEQAN